MTVATARRITQAVEPMARLAIRLPDDLMGRIERESAALGVARNTLITHTLAAHFGATAILARTGPALDRREPRTALPDDFYWPDQTTIAIPVSLLDRIATTVQPGTARRTRVAVIRDILTRAFPPMAAGGKEVPIGTN